MKLSIVVAVSTNNVIGADGALPWHLSEELRRFKKVTMGKPIVMGRTTHESIGRPLPGRRNIVMSRQPDYVADGCEVFGSVEVVMQLLRDEDEVMIIGGGDVYRQFLPQVECIYRTRVDAEANGDTWFPALDANEWRVVQSESFPVTDERDIGFTIEQLQRLS